VKKIDEEGPGGGGSGGMGAYIPKKASSRVGIVVLFLVIGFLIYTYT
jgi:hypothetical protein